MFSMMGTSSASTIQLARHLPPEDKREVKDWEKELLGMYVSGHPLQDKWELVRDRITLQSNELTEHHYGQPVTIAGSLLLHATLCKLAGVDSDTFMVTSVSAICSPPFVPMLVKALGNPGVLLSGMTTGIIGYALGNYIGISLALFLQN